MAEDATTEVADVLRAANQAAGVPDDQGLPAPVGVPAAEESAAREAPQPVPVDPDAEPEPEPKKAPAKRTARKKK